jgi:hypothetical protein
LTNDLILQLDGVIDTDVNDTGVNGSPREWQPAGNRGVSAILGALPYRACGARGE